MEEIQVELRKLAKNIIEGYLSDYYDGIFGKGIIIREIGKKDIERAKSALIKNGFILEKKDPSTVMSNGKVKAVIIRYDWKYNELIFTEEAK
jgi:hypothetical protein